MNERFGVAVAILSCSFGAGAAVATRYLIGGADPVTIAAIRFGGGALCLLAAGARPAGSRWPRGRDRIAVAALGVLFFAVFFVFYNRRPALHDGGARHARALDAAADDHGGGRGARHRGAHRAARPWACSIAIGGVAVALASGVAAAPAGAWRGDLIMAAATLCMALYSVWSRPFVDALERARLPHRRHGRRRRGARRRSARSPAALRRSPAFAPAHGSPRSISRPPAARSPSSSGSTRCKHASPTRVANTMTINPLVAGMGAALLLGEPLTANVLVGLVAVFAGIWVATGGRNAARIDRLHCPRQIHVLSYIFVLTAEHECAKADSKDIAAR